MVEMESEGCVIGERVAVVAVHTLICVHWLIVQKCFCKMTD